MKFFICEHCKNLVEMVHDAKLPMMCCGQKMTELVPNTVDAALEKHVPDVTVNGNTVSVAVGSVLHPMLEEHHIGFICLETEKGSQIVKLSVGSEPKAVFAVAEGDKPVAVYEFCNLHGLWKKEL